MTQNGYGKRTAETEYPTKSRGTQGVISIKVTERNGAVVGAVQVDDCDQIMMITDAGTLVRTRVSEISVVGRNTRGRYSDPHRGRRKRGGAATCG